MQNKPDKKNEWIVGYTTLPWLLIITICKQQITIQKPEWLLFWQSRCIQSWENLALATADMSDIAHDQCGLQTPRKPHVDTPPQCSHLTIQLKSYMCPLLQDPIMRVLERWSDIKFSFQSAKEHSKTEWHVMNSHWKSIPGHRAWNGRSAQSISH